MGSSFIHLIRTDSNEFLFNGWVIFHGVYVPQLPYPFICWWASRLLPRPGYYKQRCDEYWGARVSLRSGFLGVYVQKWDCWVIWQFYFQFFKKTLSDINHSRILYDPPPRILEIKVNYIFIKMSKNNKRKC